MRSVLRISACISLFVGVLATIGCGGGSTATPQNPKMRVSVRPHTVYQMYGMGIERPM